MDVSPNVAVAVTRLHAVIHVAQVWPGTKNSLVRLAVARHELTKALDTLTEDELAEAVRRIRPVAGQTTATRSTRALLEEARGEIAATFGNAAGKAGRNAVGPVAAKATKVAATAAKAAAGKVAEAAAPAARSTAFDLVEKVARQVGEVAIAQRAFEQALGYGGVAEIRAAADALAATISRNRKAAGLGANEVQRIRGALSTVVRGFERQVAGTAAKTLRRTLVEAMGALGPTTPIAAVLRRVLPWLAEESWPEIVAAVSRIPPIPPNVRKRAGQALADEVRWRIGAIKGVLGDAIARASRYRRIRMAELARARRFLESPAGAGYTLKVARTPIRATVQDTTRFALSYDDAIVLVNEETKKAVVVLSAQFKAGDAGALKALAQTERDVVREAGGRLLIDGQQYTVETGVLSTHRAFVGTKLGVAPDATQTFAQQLGRKELTFVDLPTDPKDLDDMAEFLLQSAGTIP
ncbi:hypothetical protein [Amycolatopsis sp. NPDC051371]|uniref:hypothetical protein n=1 Tax=Amycolatopsis sp. NPDC051371 TaxID=3155800 RepID=UPI003445BD06